MSGRSRESSAETHASSALWRSGVARWCSRFLHSWRDPMTVAEQIRVEAKENRELGTNN